jgi:hypothetical protein
LKLILMRRFLYVSTVGLKWLSCASLLGAPLLFGQEKKRSLDIGAHENLLPHGRGRPCKHMRARPGYLDLAPVSTSSSSPWPLWLLEATAEPKFLHWLDSRIGSLPTAVLVAPPCTRLSTACRRAGRCRHRRASTLRFSLFSHGSDGAWNHRLLRLFLAGLFSGEATMALGRYGPRYLFIQWSSLMTPG